MPKRKNEDEIAFLTKRLKKLEKQLKRPGSRRRSSESSSSSSSSCSTCSSASSHAKPGPEYPNDRDSSSRAAEVAEPPSNHVPSSCDVSSWQPPVVDAHCSAATAPSPPPVPVSPPARPHTRPPAAPAFAPAVPEPAVPGTSAQHAQIMPPVQQAEDVDIEDLTEILGTDPSLSVDFGDEINKDVAHRFEYIATSGLDKDGKNDLLQKYLVPSNCKLIAAPQLNAEIKAALPELVVKRDKAIESRQKQMAAAITNIGQILTSQLSKTQRDNQLLKQLMDTGRILCDLQHNESVARRNFALYSIKKEIKEQLLTTKIDKYLFGTDLPETLKTAKAVSKSGIDLKIEAPKKPKPAAATNTPKHLNWKAGPAGRRQPTGPPPKQPAAAPSRHHRVSSSHKSSHRHRQTRRR